jgi:chromosome segregation ATPase
VIFIGLLVLGITGLVFVATTYISRQKAETEAQRQESARQNEELQKERQGSIDQVRNKISALRSKLSANSKPSIESKLEAWRSKLNDFDRQLDDLNGKSSDETRIICSEIERQIQKIDEEFNNAQGLIPSRNINRFPVKL